MGFSVAEAIDVLNERYTFFTKNINEGNIEKAVTEYYTESAYATGHEAPLMKGYDAMIELFKEITSEAKNIEIQLVDTRVSGDECIYSLVTATSVIRATEEKAVIKSLLVFRKQNDGRWLCDADIFALGGF